MGEIRRMIEMLEKRRMLPAKKDTDNGNEKMIEEDIKKSFQELTGMPKVKQWVTGFDSQYPPEIKEGRLAQLSWIRDLEEKDEEELQDLYRKMEEMDRFDIKLHLSCVILNLRSRRNKIDLELK